jgi:hypothetical protein
VLQNNPSIFSGRAAKAEQIISQTAKPLPMTVTNPPETSSSSVSIARHQKRVDRLFLRFSAMYGHVWRSIYKTDEFLDYSKKAWLEGLMGFEDKSLEHALQLCLQRCHFPPTLPHFIECCKAYHKPDVFFQSKEESQKADPAVAHMHLEKIKTMLNIKPQ